MNRGQRPSQPPSNNPTDDRRHRLITELASRLQMSYGETAAMTLEDLDRRCRDRQGCSLVASVRAAESLLG